MKYSPATNGFYDIYYPENILPSDAFDISDDLYFSLLAAQEAGKQIKAVNGQPAAVDIVPQPVTQISPRQIRMAMTQLGLRNEVEAAVTAGDQDMKDWYEFSTYFDRNHPQVLAMAAALNVDDQELDALWALAATL